MLLKPGVDISRLNRKIRSTLPIVDSIILVTSGSEAVVTSTYEGLHGQGSLHYANDAYDIRLTKNSSDVAAQIKRQIGRDFDVVLEPDHYHIEYDPKG